MIRVKYEEYTNDYARRYKEKTFYFLGEFQDWFFSLCDGKWEDKIFIPDPDNTQIFKDGPCNLDVNCMWTQNKHYWIHQIEDGGRIIFSDGKHTNHIKHWNDEVKQMCRDMRKRQRNPQFNFG